MNAVSLCFSHPNLPERFWHNALRNVVATRNTVPHTTTANVPFTTVFIMMATYMKHIRPFRCRVNYRSKAHEPTKFRSRVRFGLHVLHDDKGVYRIFTGVGEFCTKHLSLLGIQFPGLSVIGNNRNTPSMQTIMMQTS